MNQKFTFMEKIPLDKKDFLKITKSKSFLDDYEIMYDIYSDHIWLLPHQRLFEYVFIFKGKDFGERLKGTPEKIINKIYEVIYKIERMNTC